MHIHHHDAARRGPIGFATACILTLILGLVAATVAPAHNAAAQAPSSPYCVVSTAGLVGWWPFDESHPEGIEADAYGNYPIGTTTGTVAPDPDGMSGTAASFASPGHVTVAPGVDFAFADQYSVDLYFKTTATSGTLVDFRDSSWGGTPNPNFGGFLIHLLNSGQLLWQTPNATGSYGWHGVGGPLPQPVNDGQWHRLTITRDGQLNNMYVDGALAFSTVGGDGDNNNPDQDLRFGAEHRGTSSFVGSLDEVMVYDRALTEQEIATNGCITAGPDGCTTDAYEPNDSEIAAAPITAGATINAVVCDNNDDWFTIDVGAGETIDVDLQFIHVDGDVDVALLGPSGAVVAASNGITNTESMSYVATTSGPLEIRVYLHIGTANDYALTATVTPAPNPTCGGLTVTIDMNTNGGNGTGTAGTDVILGTPGADLIEGRGGDDRICGGGGNDEIRGNAGRDIIDGGGGNDLIFGGAGSDSLTGGDGEDTIYGQFGGDTIRGGNDDDLLLGGPGFDTVYGEAGDDNLQGAGGNDRLWGGDGNDRVYGKAGQDEMYGGAGNDELYGASGADRIDGGDGDDRIQGAGGADVLLGGNGTDVLFGQNGNDLMDGEDGNDTLYGSRGDDEIYGGDGDDNLQGASGNDTLSAGPGNDVLYAGAGTDQLNGGPEADTCWGGATDTLINC